MNSNQNKTLSFANCKQTALPTFLLTAKCAQQELHAENRLIKHDSKTHESSTTLRGIPWIQSASTTITTHYLYYYLLPLLLPTTSTTTYYLYYYLLPLLLPATSTTTPTTTYYLYYYLLPLLLPTTSTTTNYLLLPTYYLYYLPTTYYLPTYLPACLPTYLT